MRDVRLLPRHLTVLLAVVSVFVLASCASYFLRKECEATDWFAYGEKVAMQGRRLTGDEFIGRCKQAEANINEVNLDRGFKVGMSNYCKPEVVFQTGKKGQFLNIDMCDGEQPRFLQKRHAEGVREYCSKSNGFAAGAVGTKYNGICPKDLEPDFRPEFNRGRKSYLVGMVNSRERQIDDIDREIRSLESRRNQLMMQMTTMGDGRKYTRVTKYDPNTNTTREEMETTLDESTQQRRRSLQQEIESANNNIETKHKQQSDIRQEIRGYTAELSTL